MKKGKANLAKIAREESDLKNLLGAFPSNPIAWSLVIKVVAPIIARLAVRYALKRIKRDMSEDKVNAIGVSVADFIATAVNPQIDKKGSK